MKIDWKDLKRRAPKQRTLWSKKEDDILREAIKHGVRNAAFIRSELKELKDRTAAAIKVRMDRLSQETK